MTKFNETFQDERAQLRAEEDWLTCDDCRKAKADVRETTCPYAEEINDDIVEVTLCDDCYGERCDDI